MGQSLKFKTSSILEKHLEQVEFHFCSKYRALADAFCAKHKISSKDKALEDIYKEMFKTYRETYLLSLTKFEQDEFKTEASVRARVEADIVAKFADKVIAKEYAELKTTADKLLKNAGVFGGYNTIHNLHFGVNNLTCSNILPSTYADMYNFNPKEAAAKYLHTKPANDRVEFALDMLQHFKENGMIVTKHIPGTGMDKICLDMDFIETLNLAVVLVTEQDALLLNALNAMIKE